MNHRGTSFPYGGVRFCLWLWKTVSAQLVTVLFVCAVLNGACGPPPSGWPRDGAPVGAAGQPVRTAIANTPPPTISPPSAPAGAPLRPNALGLLTTGDVHPTMPAPVPSPPPRSVIVATNGAGANLRTGPSMAGRVVATLAEGTPVDILGDPVAAEGRSWRQIRGGGQEGWVVSVAVRQR